MLLNIFRIPPVPSHCMLHRLFSVCLGLGVLSKGVLRWAKEMNPFALDEERPWHGKMVTEGVERKKEIL